MVTTSASDQVSVADKSLCAAIKADLRMCLLASDCCKKDKKTPRECQRKGSLPEECAELRQTYRECKRSLHNNMSRFRGLKDIEASTEQQVTNN